jgi:2-isopropylmalate synthase
LGNGPVSALDMALRKALEEFYPNLKEVQLIDYKVRIVNESEGTSAKVRVLIESTDRKRKWGTVGVSENIIEASWIALTDSIVYKLMKDEEEME